MDENTLGIDDSGNLIAPGKGAAEWKSLPTHELRERLANEAHEAWSGWMNYMFEKGYYNRDMSFTIPPWLAERWSRQAATVYADLPEDEKESDHKEADRYLAVIFNFYRNADED